MIALLDTMGPAIWRASWQSAALAVPVFLLLRCLGERLSPRWRFWIWGLVIARLLFVATPASPWSAFNLASGIPHQEPDGAPIAQTEVDPQRTPVEFHADETGRKPPETPAPVFVPFKAQDPVPAGVPHRPSQTAIASAPPTDPGFDRVLISRILTAFWLAGSMILSLRLLANVVILRRRLSACRPVRDPSLLELLKTSCRRIGLNRPPQLLVTPECLSPFTAGTWRPKIVLPESVVTGSSTERLSHVLAHELAHLVRRDLWTNWLLLAARTLHWFNPVVWWTVREMQAEREAACDDLACDSLGAPDRSAYAATIVELAASLTPSAIVPGLVGFLSSARRLKKRITRLVGSPPGRTLRAPIAAGLLIGLAMLGLTDAMPGVEGKAPKDAPPEKHAEPKANTYTVSGRCVENADKSPLAGISVRLYRVAGRTSPPKEIAKTRTDAAGRYTFTGLVPPRTGDRSDYLKYEVVGFAENRPIGITFMHTREGKEVVEIQMTRETSTVSGQVVDANGRPVAGAAVLPHFVINRPVPGLNSTTTDANGRFKLENIGVYKWPSGKPVPVNLAVRHRDYPPTSVKAKSLPADLTVTLPIGCSVTGVVTDEVTGQPAAGATIIAHRLDEWGKEFAATDKMGRFRLVVPEGRYNFQAESQDRVCVAVTDIECLAGEKIELPALKLIAGGFISGRIVNTATGQSVSVSENGEPIRLGLFGPSQPKGQAMLTEADDKGGFVLRAAPGENFPYLLNIRGERMVWTTKKEPPVVVKAGETTAYNMLITPPDSPEEKLKAAQKLVEELSAKPTERTAQILLEFRKLNHTVDETELWCSLMRELVAVGADATPQLCAELDRTTESGMLRRLGFALRAIGDPRAVPALIRSIPKTLLPASSDYGLIVGDKDLTEFMQTHDLDKRKRGTYFSFGRPLREIFGALHKLAGQDFADAELFFLFLSEDPRRQILQRRIFEKQANRWQTWWEANWQNFTKDKAYQKVDLKLAEKPLPPAPNGIGKSARIGDGMSGAVLSPPTEKGQSVDYFYDLDTGYQPHWPSEIPRDAESRKEKQLDDWASERGVDLMCITHRSPDGTETYVLRALGMKVKEISPRDARNLDNLIGAGKLPEGRPVGELLMHYDEKSQQYVPNADGAFLFVTREGNLGLIQTTDRITQTANLTGQAGPAPPGVGFHKGVRFDLKEIVP